MGLRIATSLPEVQHGYTYAIIFSTPIDRRDSLQRHLFTTLERASNRKAPALPEDPTPAPQLLGMVNFAVLILSSV
jgi:hypothetical protein